jgi:O-antigen/teichoic acid export membrane protein
MPNDLTDIAGQSARGSFILFLGDAASTIVLALGSILIARFLGPEGYGVYSLTLAVPAIFISIISLGIDSAAVRFLAKFRSEYEAARSISFMKTSIVFRFIIAIAAWSICFLSSDILASYLLNRPEVSFYIKLSSSLILFQALFNLLYSMSVGLDSYNIGSATKICMSLVKSFLAPLLVFIGLGVAGAVLGHVLGFAVAAIAGALAIYLGPYKNLRRLLRDCGEYENGFIENLKLMISYGIPLYLSFLILLLVDQYRLILLAHIASDFEIGNFQAAGNFATLLVVLSTPIATALFPAFSKLDPTGEEVKKAFHYSVKYTGILIAPAALFTICMSRILVEIVYGHEYSMAPIFLSLYTIVYLYSVFGSIVLDNFFSGVGETRINFKTTIVYVSSFIPLSVILTYFYSVVGLIASILVSSILKVSYGLFVAKRRLGISIDLNNSIRILIASGVAALSILPFSLNQSIPNYVSLLMGGILYLVVYMTMLPIVKALQRTDITILRNLFQNQGVLKPVAEILVKYESSLIERMKRQ